MSEENNNPVRKYLLDDLNKLKEKRKESKNRFLEGVESQDITASLEIDILNADINVIIEEGKSFRKILELLESLKGQEVNDEMLTSFVKYRDYLKSQINSSKEIIKIKEETKNFEDSL